MRPRRARTRLALAAVAATAALTAAACGSSSSPSAAAAAGAPVSGGTATFAEQPATAPNYIFPLMPGQYANNANISDFQFLMFRPLYWFGYQGKPSYNPGVSLAERPVFSNGNKTVTVTLKPYQWSNGTPVTNADVALWVNMVKAEKTHWFGYVPGAFPDDITAMTLSGTQTITFTLSKAFSTQWFLHNQLSQITPLPAAWDETAPGAPSHCDTTIADCAAVYKFLAGQSKDLTTYATNPLWQIVDGPWKLSSFTTAGRAVFVPNPKYSGSSKPRLAQFIEEPFSTDSAEYNVLRAGGLTYGYVPTSDIGLPLSGYQVQPWNGWTIALLFLNYHNRTAGPVFAQTYVRQAMQHLIDQTGLITAAFHGAAVPDYGPVPLTPKTSLLSSYVQSDPYPFSVASATALLSSHGWKVVPGGTDTCQKPGSGTGECGAGVAAGASLSFTFSYPSGIQAVDLETQFLKSDFAKAGITLTLKSTPNVLSQVQSCTTNQPLCSWQIGDYGPVSWFFGNDSYPTGGQLFQTGSGFNAGSYSSPALDTLISATHTSSSVSALKAYEDFMASQLPVLWQPSSVQQVSAVVNTLHGAYPQDPILNIYPENWYFTK
ncbi:MAG: ABC transporter substrate-binding protein [Actinomycetes bacterium]